MLIITKETPFAGASFVFLRAVPLRFLCCCVGGWRVVLCCWLALLRAVGGFATVLAVWILIFELLDGLGNLAVSLEVFPEANLIAVNDHLVGWTVQLTAEFYKREAGLLFGVLFVRIWLCL